jgi:HAD superfamily hydrolase (TIGR01509 family)
MLQAVIFDFDGVISDTEQAHLQAFNQVLARLGIEITQQAYYEEYIRYPDLECFKTIVARHNLPLDAVGLDELIRQKGRIFRRLIKKHNSIITGVPQFLRMLSENNIRMAICTGCLRGDIEAILGGTDLSGFFETMVTADDITSGKPDPQGYRLVLARLNETEAGIRPDECIAIEDSPWGLQAAAAAGIHTVAVTNTYTARQLSSAGRIVTHLAELTIDELRAMCTRDKLPAQGPG